MFRLGHFGSIAADENSAARLRRFARSRYHPRCAGVVCTNAAPAPSPSRKESPPASADYDLRWGVKIPMRDKVELNATLYLPKTADGSLPRMPVIFTLTPSSPNSIFWQKNYCSGGIVADETAKDARIAQIQVHHDAEHASSMRLPLR